MGAFKNKYLRKHASLLHRRDDPPTGWLVSATTSCETRALGQIRSFLDTLLFQLFPDAEPKWPEVIKELDVDESHLEEQDIVNNDDENSPKKQRYFQMVDAASAGLLFVRFRCSVDPIDLWKALVKHIRQLDDSSRQSLLSKLSFCHRILPIEHVCSADSTTITADLTRVLQTHDLSKAKTVAIVAECRNNPSLSTKKLIEAAATVLPTQLKVNLTKPDIVVFITVFKSCCGIAIYDDYYGLSKHNIHKI